MMISRRKIFSVFAGLGAALISFPAIASRNPKKWSNKTVFIRMEIYDSTDKGWDDEILEGFANDSEVLDAILENMKRSISTYIRTGRKE